MMFRRWAVSCAVNDYVSPFKVVSMKCTDPGGAGKWYYLHPSECPFHAVERTVRNRWNVSLYSPTPHAYWSYWREQYAETGDDTAKNKMLQTVTAENPPVN